jgi:hypothetical protein
MENTLQQTKPPEKIATGIDGKANVNVGVVNNVNPTNGIDKHIRNTSQPSSSVHNNNVLPVRSKQMNPESSQLGSTNHVARPQQQQQQQQQLHHQPQVYNNIQLQNDVGNGGMRPTMPQNHHTPQPQLQITVAPITGNIQLQQQATPPVIQQEILPVVSGKEGRVTEKKGRFSIIKDIPKQTSPQRMNNTNDTQRMHQGLLNRKIDESAINIQGQQQHQQHHHEQHQQQQQQIGMMPSKIAPQHLNQNPVQVPIPAAPEHININRSTSNITSPNRVIQAGAVMPNVVLTPAPGETQIKGRFSTSSNRVIQAGVAMPNAVPTPAPGETQIKGRFSTSSNRVIQAGVAMPNAVPTPAGAGETQIKGRFLVTKSADKGAMKHHNRSHSLPSTTQQQQQYPQTMVTNVPGMQMNLQQCSAPLPSGQQQHTINVNQIPMQQGQQLIRTNGIQSARSSPIVVPHEYVSSVNTFPPPPPVAVVSNKPPMLPKVSISPISGSKSGLSSSSCVPSSMGKMFHFLDKMKVEANEADKLINFLVSLRDIHACIHLCHCFFHH